MTLWYVHSEASEEQDFKDDDDGRSWGKLCEVGPTPVSAGFVSAAATCPLYSNHTPLPGVTARVPSASDFYP